MSDEENRGTEGLIPLVGGALVPRSSVLVRRGLRLLEQRKPAEDAAITRLRARANAGDLAAQYNLGWRHSTGRGVPQDCTLAAQWFLKAAEQGHAPAQFHLGVRYATGEGVPQDYAQAVQWLHRAAEQGSAPAQFNLGLLYNTGQGVPRDYAQAVLWYRRAAEQGHASAQLNLGGAQRLQRAHELVAKGSPPIAALRQAQRENAKRLGARSANPIRVAQTADGIARGQRLVDPALVRKRWDALESVALRELALTENDIGRGQTSPHSIGSILEVCVGASVTNGATIMASYSGDTHGGHTEFYALVDGQKRNHLDAIRFQGSLEGAIEGLYFAFALRQHGAFWHGLSGRDYTFLFSPDQLAEVLEARRQADPSGVVAQIDRPCGVRLLTVADGHRVSCMAASPTGTIVDLSVRLAAGRLTIEPVEEISVSSVSMFY